MNVIKITTNHSQTNNNTAIVRVKIIFELEGFNINWFSLLLYCCASCS